MPTHTVFLGPCHTNSLTHLHTHTYTRHPKSLRRSLDSVSPESTGSWCIKQNRLLFVSVHIFIGKINKQNINANDTESDLDQNIAGKIWLCDWQTPTLLISGGWLRRGVGVRREGRGGSKQCGQTCVLRNYSLEASSLSTPGLQCLIKEEEKMRQIKEMWAIFWIQQQKKKTKHICIVGWRSQVLVIAAEASVATMRRGALVCSLLQIGERCSSVTLDLL